MIAVLEPFFFFLIFLDGELEFSFEVLEIKYEQ